MAVKPYRETDVWSFRLRLKGQSIYRTGFATEAVARREAERLRQKILEAGKPKHDGPWRTTLAQALQLYAVERLPFLKGARQDADRINRYLRAAGFKIVKLTKLPADVAENGCYYEVSLAAGDEPRKIPKSLRDHRRRQAERTEQTERLIRHLARTPMAQILNYQIQELVDAMLRDGYEAASVGLERALIRRLFNYARKTWLWVEPASNPAARLTMPKIDNARDRVLTNAEWARLSPELEKESNPFVAPAITLLLETAMRVSEPLLHATWADVDWHRCLIRLRDAKAGAPQQVVTELKNRGVQDIFIACVDGLKGFPEAIEAVYPHAAVQLCIVHMVRNSLNYVSWKMRAEVATDLKRIYTATTADEAEQRLGEFEGKWDDAYLPISQSWRRNWLRIIPFFDYPLEIRKVIYTTNAIESVNMSLRKITKNRGSFPSDDALSKLFYLALRNISRKWTMPIRDWKAALTRFTIQSEDRMSQR